MSPGSKKLRNVTKVNALLTFSKVDAVKGKTQEGGRTSSSQKQKSKKSFAGGGGGGGSALKGRRGTPSPSDGSIRSTASSSPRAQGRGTRGGGGGGGGENDSQQNIASAFVSVLADKGAERKGKQLNKGPANRAQRLQVTLDDLEDEMGKLKNQEQLLECRIKDFTRRKHKLLSTLDGIHAKLEELSRNHKDIGDNNSNLKFKGNLNVTSD